LTRADLKLSSCALAVHDLGEALGFYRDVDVLVFVTDDCDAAFERIEAAGAEVMQEPINRPDDVRDCAFLDPSGNMLRFVHPRQVNQALPSRQAHSATGSPDTLNTAAEKTVLIT
jgi:hypothetical protein